MRCIMGARMKTFTLLFLLVALLTGSALAQAADSACESTVLIVKATRVQQRDLINYGSPAVEATPNPQFLRTVDVFTKYVSQFGDPTYEHDHVTEFSSHGEGLVLASPIAPKLCRGAGSVAAAKESLAKELRSIVPFPNWHLVRYEVFAATDDAMMKATACGSWAYTIHFWARYDAGNMPSFQACINRVGVIDSPANAIPNEDPIQEAVAPSYGLKHCTGYRSLEQAAAIIRTCPGVEKVLIKEDGFPVAVHAAAYLNLSPFGEPRSRPE
jgi:hypothetical protein